MYNVLGVGQPLLDKIFRVSFETMDALGIKERGGSSLIGEEELEELLQKLYTIIEHDCEANMQENFVRTSDDEEDTVESPTTVCDKDFKPVVIAGGSCSNTIKGVSAFGERCAYVGKIGRDSAGKYYKQSLSKRGVIPLMTETFGRTGQVLCLITPDGQRTMRAFLGASSEMNESDLIPNDFHGVSLVHMEGYSIYNQPLLMQALKLAKDNQAMVSYDMGSYEVVRGFRTQIIEVLTNYVDIVFCNSEEASVITNGGTPEECVDYLGSLCRVAVVMMGKEGCWVRSGKEKYRCPTKAIQNPVDTTGAGDLFASGFLYAYLQGYSLEQCARLGALSGAEVVQVMGADIPTDRFAKIKQDVNTTKLMTNTGKVLEKSTVEYYGTSPSKNILFPQKIKTAV